MKMRGNRWHSSLSVCCVVYNRSLTFIAKIKTYKFHYVALGSMFGLVCEKELNEKRLIWFAYAARPFVSVNCTCACASVECNQSNHIRQTIGTIDMVLGLDGDDSVSVSANESKFARTRTTLFAVRCCQSSNNNGKVNPKNYKNEWGENVDRFW